MMWACYGIFVTWLGIALKKNVCCRAFSVPFHMNIYITWHGFLYPHPSIGSV